MPRIFSKTEPVDRPAFDIYCGLEADYPEKFLYIEKDGRIKVMGLGCLYANETFEPLPLKLEGRVKRSPVLFAAGLFDPEDSRPKNPLFHALEGAAYVLPQLVLIEQGGRTYAQVNDTKPITANPSEVVSAAPEPCDLVGRDIDHTLIPDSRQAWFANVDEALRRIREHELDKVVLARQLKVETGSAFTSRDMVANLIASGVPGTLFLHQVNGAFFIGSTPELLVRKEGNTITTMCLAGTTPIGESEKERVKAALWLLNDPKNLREHAYVADHLHGCLDEVCSKVRMPEGPSVLTLKHLQHLCTPVTAKVPKNVSLIELRDRLHPTPALAGSPVDEAKAAIREMEDFNRGFYGGTFGYLDLDGNGEFSVAIRSGVFGKDHGYVYAGCGIVEGSDPASEYDEIEVKLKTILSAFQGPEGGSGRG